MYARRRKRRAVNGHLRDCSPKLEAQSREGSRLIKVSFQSSIVYTSLYGKIETRNNIVWIWNQCEICCGCCLLFVFQTEHPNARVKSGPTYDYMALAYKTRLLSCCLLWLLSPLRYIFLILALDTCLMYKIVQCYLSAAPSFARNANEQFGQWVHLRVRQLGRTRYLCLNFTSKFFLDIHRFMPSCHFCGMF